jgi:hypothetical protein
MLTKNVKNLFDFIKYLHSQIEYLLSKNLLIEEVNDLLEQRRLINPSKNYKNKLQYDLLQRKIEKNFIIIDKEIINPLKDKIMEFEIADISTPIVSINAQADLFELQRSFESDDLIEIFSARKKYLNFRNSTNFDFYLQFFFFELDRTLREFYDYFKDEKVNSFDNLRTNVITVEILDLEGIEKAVKRLTDSSNKLHFDKFSSFLNYFKNEAENLIFESEAFRLLQFRREKLSIATFQSEIDDIKLLSENAIKELKNNLLLSFTNENYKTKVNDGLNPHILEKVKLYFEYESLYNETKLKADREIDTFKKFTSILDRIYDEDFDFTVKIDYAKITTEIISEIKEKLFELQNNEQRLGFLKTLFRNFFDNGKDFNFYNIHKVKDTFLKLPEDQRDYNEKEFKFLSNCLSSLSEIILAVSEEVLIYDINFEDVIFWAWRHAENGKQNPYEVFTYYVKSNNRIKSDFNENISEKFTTKQYVIAYILDNYASGTKLPHGNKKELEKIGNKILGDGRGNTFYKNYNKIINKDLFNKNILSEEAGSEWRDTVLSLSVEREVLEAYLKSKNI